MTTPCSPWSSTSAAALGDPMRQRVTCTVADLVAILTGLRVEL